MNFDWKFLVTIIATIAGILVPVWLWQADLGARSLSVRLVSTISLQSPQITSIPDIQISIDGVNVNSPYLSTLTILNDGSKPISAGDFESVLELSVEENAGIIRARVVSVAPPNLKAEIKTEKNSLHLSPLLLNPGDRLTIAFITSGGPPVFHAAARIAGIKEINFEDGTKRRESWWRILFYSLTALFAYVLYWIYGAALLKPESVRLNRVLAIITMLVCGLYSGAKINWIYGAMGFDIDGVNFWIIAVMTSITGLPILIFTKRRNSRAAISVVRNN